MIQNIINHVAFVLDASGSMRNAGLEQKVIQVFNRQIESLAKKSQVYNQETRISIYLFGSEIECLVYDMDVMRLPQINNHYRATGSSTRLIDGTLQALSDLQETPQKYCDHAFLLYVLTDGEENASKHWTSELRGNLTNCDENWTVACFVPNQRGMELAREFGFYPENVTIWDVSQRGMDNTDKLIDHTTESFFVGRSKGIRGTRSLFQTNIKATSKQVANRLDEIDPAHFMICKTARDEVIQPFVERKTRRPYVRGNSYYQLVKSEIIQAYKQICVQDRTNDRVYSGNNARAVLGLPDHELRVTPGDHKNFDIFVQSTSVNRKLPRGTKIIILS